MVTLPEKATRPTLYFIGVTTGQSSIMKVFPVWAEALGIDAVIKGIDIGIHAPAEEYRAVAQFIKDDELIEVTPKTIRVRKSILNTANRLKAQAKLK